MQFLKNRAIQVRVIKPEDASNTTTPQSVDIVAASDVALVQVQNLAMCVGAVLAGKRILNSVCTIAETIVDTRCKTAANVAIEAARAAAWKANGV